MYSSEAAILRALPVSGGAAPSQPAESCLATTLVYLTKTLDTHRQAENRFGRVPKQQQIQGPLNYRLIHVK